MKGDQYAAEVSLLIGKDLRIGSEQLAPQATMEELKRKLTLIITHLLDKDFEKFLHIMYRIDINEDKLKIALSAGTSELVAPSIAQLVIDRALQKVKTRNQYRS